MEKIEMIAMIPEEGKCWKNSNGHKFVHTNGKIGLPLYIEDNEEAKKEFREEYIQVNIK